MRSFESILANKSKMSFVVKVLQFPKGFGVHLIIKTCTENYSIQHAKAKKLNDFKQIVNRSFNLLYIFPSVPHTRAMVHIIPRVLHFLLITSAPDKPHKTTVKMTR